jgi:hypothetical protein
MKQGWLAGAALGAALIGLIWFSLAGRAPRPQPPVSAAPEVLGLLLRGATGEVVSRTPPATFVKVNAPVSLSLETTAVPDRVEFYAVYADPPVDGSEFGPGPGLIGRAAGGEPWPWPIRPGQQAEVYGIAWYGKQGVRSESLHVGYPMPDETRCPDVSFPPLRPIAHAQVSLISSVELNLIEIVTPYEHLYFSLKVDPATCRDELIRHWLEQAPWP